MTLNRPSSSTLIAIVLILVFGLAFSSACGGASTEAVSEMDMKMGDSMGSEPRIPNANGEVVRIVSPENGAVFKENDDIIIVIEVENFVLGEGDNHWHVYVDGMSWKMILGGDTDMSLHGLGPGVHTVEVHLSTGVHEELEDGDSITLTIEPGG